MPRDRTPSSSSTRRPQQHDNRSITATAQPEHTMLASQPHPTPVSFYGHPAHHRPMGWHSSDPHRPRISPPQPQPMPGRSEPRQTRPRPVSPVSVSVSGQRSAPADRRDHQDHRQAGAMTMTRNDSGGSQGSASSSASASMRGHSFHDHPYTQPRHGPIETPALPSSSVPVTEQGSPPRQRRTRVLMTRLQWNALTALWDQVRPRFIILLSKLSARLTSDHLSRHGRA
jgi:hypothetical protein